MPPIIHWFRRDLRLHDNTALAAAAKASGGAVIPVFIVDDRLLRGRYVSAARVRFLLESLQELDGALRERGSLLLLRRGDPVQELLRLAGESGAAGIYWNRDYSPYATARDHAVEQAMRAAGYTTRSFKDAVIWEQNEVVKADGQPYTVYTPYARRWREHLAETGVQVTGLPALHGLPEPLPPTQPIPALADLGLHTEQTVIPGGERHAEQVLNTFTDLRRQHNITSYGMERDLPGVPATSRLSAHLRAGTISIRVCLQAALDTEQSIAYQKQDREAQEQTSSIERWINELIWRDFYVQILANFPHVMRGAFKREFDVLNWENNAELFAAWCAGRTGYPIVDAAMRQLTTTAWMHNRCRMIVASFLTKDLLIDWRWGERYFMQHLVDGDPAANNGGWQWSAGTGTDAQPYFRIFNPTSQGKKFDPEGVYVRHYLPELANVSEKYIHEPWKMPAQVQQDVGVIIGQDYPAPVVDHAVQRQRALEMYKDGKREA